MLCNFLCLYPSLSPTEAQDAEPTVEERFSQFGQQMTEMGQTVAEKARAAMDTVQNSEFAKKTK